MSNTDFDALSSAAYQENAPIENLDRLWQATFSLSEWYFIARGKSPKVYPYIGHMGERPMIYGFTDKDRLEIFSHKHQIFNENNEVAILSIPTTNIVDYLEKFQPHGVQGIWFNPDDQGFYAPMENLRPIKNRVDSLLA